MPDYVTKDHFDGAIATIRGDIRDVIQHFNKSQSIQNERMDRMENNMNEKFGEVDAKLDAIMGMLATRQELRNLIRELKKKGVAVEEAEVLLN